jgi:hypothetical protein
MVGITFEVSDLAVADRGYHPAAYGTETADGTRFFMALHFQWWRCFGLYTPALGTSYIGEDYGRDTKTTEFYKFPARNLHILSSG